MRNAAAREVGAGGQAVHSQSGTKGRARQGNTPAVQAAGLSRFHKELEEVIAISVCNTSRQHRGREQ